jgi:glutathione S-transferase
MEKRLLGLGAPDLHNLRQGRDGLRTHLFYIDKLLQEREWLAGRRLSLADFAAAAHLSVIDYCGDMPWADFPAVKTWYMKLKSRPCFRPLLADRWPGLVPPRNYDDLDF